MTIILLMEKHPYLFRGRLFTTEQLELVKDTVAEHKFLSRRQVAEILWERLNWRDFKGSLKVIAALEALRRMEEKGFLTLPPGKPFGGYHQMRPLRAQEVDFKEPQEELAGSIETMGQLRFELTRRIRRGCGVISSSATITWGTGGWWVGI